MTPAGHDLVTSQMAITGTEADPYLESVLDQVQAGTCGSGQVSS